ncbi:MAG: HEAT repeat domain-containing protein [Acidobacteria bacterium]|nr:HEAT repeat domain-containing protein [Acidobacteriota bacterium]
MDQISDDPEKLTQFLNIFEGNEDGIEFVKRIYDSELINRKFEKDWRDTVKTWLTYNSPFFSNELARMAQAVRDENDYVTNQDELRALARVDWDKAEPLLNKLSNDASQPVSQTLARWAYYERAMEKKDEIEASKWRDLLKATVEDKNQKPGNRDLAMDALVESGDFEGRDEWYMSLLEDETLHDLRVNGQTYTGLTTILNHSEEGKYTKRMIDLLGSSSKTVRSAAVRNLAGRGGTIEEEAVRLMLPWLDDPDWATDINNSRRALISALKEYRMPESVPGLLAVLAERKLRKTPSLSANSANTFPRASNSAVNTVSSEIQVFQNLYEYQNFVGEIVGALGNQRDARAVPELRSVMPEFESWQRQNVIRAILNCGGFSTYEQVDAIEHVARLSAQREEAIRQSVNSNTAVDAETIELKTVTVTNMAARLNTDDPNELKSQLGSALYQNDNPTEDLVSAMISRIEALEKKEPPIAAQMREVLRNWRGVAVNAVLMRTVKNGKAELSDALKLLARRKEIREAQINDIYDLRGGVPFAVGLSACLLEQNGEYDAALDGDDLEVKITALGCARLIRAPLPVRKVADLMNSPDKNLSTAAEKYLESEDSLEARGFVLAKHPNEAKVLGARTSFTGKGEFSDALREVFATVTPFEFGFGFGTEFEELDKIEEKLKKEVIENQELIGVYAFDKHFVRMYKDRAVFSWEEDPARFRERTLETNEIERLKGYLAESGVDDLPPFLTFCGEYCANSKELLMLGRGGGRRVFTLGFQTPPFFVKLNAIFEDLKRPPAKLQYYLQKRVPGLEILFEDKELTALTVWKTGPDLRVLTDNSTKREQIEKELAAQDDADEENEDFEYEEYRERRRKRRELRAYENLNWFRFGGGRPIAAAEQPAGFSFIPNRDRLTVQPDQLQWKARTSTVEIRADSEGIYKVVRGQLTRIRAGFFENPVVTPNGRWVIARKYGSDESDVEDQSYGVGLVRINLATGKEFKVPYQQYPPLLPIAFVVGQNKVLLGAAYTYGDEEENVDDFVIPEPSYQKYYWLDPETGALAETKGNVEALSQQMFRPLQPVNAKPDEFWAAIPDAEKNKTDIGIYNQRTLAFKPLLTLPQIEFNSMRMWVDEAENKAYFAYAGHLLSVPLK